MFKHPLLPVPPLTLNSRCALLLVPSVRPCASYLSFLRLSFLNSKTGIKITIHWVVIRIKWANTYQSLTHTKLSIIINYFRFLFLALFGSRFSFLTGQPYLWFFLYAPCTFLQPSPKLANLQILNWNLPTGSHVTRAGLLRAAAPLSDACD